MKLLEFINEEKLNKALAKTYEYVDNPKFHENDKTFLNYKFTNNLSTIPYYIGKKREKYNPLTHEQENIAFLQYNYYKFKYNTIISELCNKLSISLTNELFNTEKLINESLNFIVSMNLGLINVKGSSMYASVDEDDKISDANLSLLHAIEKFDISRGYRFSTYATWAILNGLTKTSQANAKIKENVPHSLDVEKDDGNHTISLYPVAAREENPDIAMIDVIRKLLDTDKFNLSDFELKVLHLRYLGENSVSVRVAAEKLGVNSYEVTKTEKKIFPKMKKILELTCS